MNKNSAVIMCTWRRLSRLPHTIDMLRRQSYKDFDFLIWNNNSDYKDPLEKLKKENPDIIKTIKHSPANIGGIGRFHLAQEVMGDYKHIIFIDDDQDFKDHLLEEMVSVFRPRHIISWWAYNLTKVYVKRVGVRDPEANCDYCGTGGLITDSDLFKELDLSECPPEYSFVEDLWLSFVAKYELDYILGGYAFPLTIVPDGKDQWGADGNAGGWKEGGIKRKKQEFMEYLFRKYENTE